MRIQEITSYKKTDVYEIFKNSHSIHEFDRRMKNAGYEEYRIGWGFYASVWHYTGDPFVIKFFKDDRGYNEYLKFMLANQDNPHVPKIFGRPVSLRHPYWKDIYRIVRLELLEPYDGYNPYQNKMYQLIKNSVNGVNEYYKKELYQTFPKIEPIIDYLNKKREAVDLNPGNIMFRGTTPIISDPLSYGGSFKDFGSPVTKKEVKEDSSIGLSKRAYENLSDIAQHAIDTWEWASCHTGLLSRDYKENGPIRQELEKAMVPIKKFIRKKHGDTITLYRGMGPEEFTPDTDLKLFSWTSNPKQAKVYARQLRYRGKNTPKYSSYEIKQITDQDIETAVSNMKKRGYAKFRNHQYIRSKENPDYINIFRGREFITDMDYDDFEDDLKREQKEVEEYNREAKQKYGKVIKKEIPVDDIYWVLGGVSQEFIVKDHYQ